MDFRSVSLAAFLSTLFLSLPDAINGVSVQTLIENACLLSSNTELCLVTLQQNSATSSAINEINLAEIAISPVTMQSTQAVIFFASVAPKHQSFQPLTLCAKLFQKTKALLLINDGYVKTGFATLSQNNALIMVERCEAALIKDTVKIYGVREIITKWKTLFDAAHAATLAAEFGM